MASTQVRANQILDATITDADVAAANKDGTSGTPSMRTLGTGGQQAAAGSHTHAHNTLTGLSSDDHSQYLKVAGRSGGQTVVGDSSGTAGLGLQLYANATQFSAGTFIQITNGGELWLYNASVPEVKLKLGGEVNCTFFVSTAAIGVAPYQCTSTTVCTNLNADMVDGKHAASFVLLAGLAGGQTIIGGTAASEKLVLQSTSHATRSIVEIVDGFALSGDISATLTTASTNPDFAPTGFAGASVLRITPTASSDIGGLAGGTDGRVVTFINVDTALPFRFLNENTGSVAANRFTLPGNSTIVLNPRDSATAIYDSTSSRWRLTGLAQRTVLRSGIVGGQGIIGGTASHDVITLSGATSSSGGVKVTDAFFVTNFLSPLQITADQNNYAPTNADLAFVLRVNADNNTRKLTGIDSTSWSSPDGRLLALLNAGTTFITLVHQSASSTAGNKFSFPGAVDCILDPGSCILFWYDATTTSWVPLGSSLVEKGGLGTATASVSSTTTAETKSLIGAALGTFTLPANQSIIGRTLRMKLKGVLTTGATAGTITFQVKFGSTVIASTGAVAPTISQANRYWEAELDIVVRSTGATGTVFCQGMLFMMNAATPTAGVSWPIRGNSADPPAVVTVDTTAASLIDFQSITSNALHTITCNMASLEVVI
jgi:hypothetical protein